MRKLPFLRALGQKVTFFFQSSLSENLTGTIAPASSDSEKQLSPLPGFLNYCRGATVESKLWPSLPIAGARGLKTSSWEPGRPENHDFHDFCDFGHLGRSSWSPIPVSISSYGQATDLRLSPNDAEYLTVCRKNMRSQNELTDF